MSKTTTIRNWYPHPFAVDPDDDDQPVTLDLRVTRFAVEQGKTFNIQWAQHMDSPSGRRIYRQASGDEQEKRTLPKGREVFAIDDEEIRRRRILEMEPQARAAFLEEEEHDSRAAYDFLVETVREYIRVAPGQIIRWESEDGETVELRGTGADLVRLYGGHRPILTRLATAVWAENNLSAALKNAFRSRSASSTSSTEPGTAAPGQRPDGIAAPAAPEASVATEAATAPSATIPSGSIAS